MLIGIASNGPHTNGYSLLRKVFEWAAFDATPPGFDRPLGETLMVPHRSYLDVLRPVLATDTVKALAHITGGGLIENVPRVLPSGVDAEIRLGSWPVPPLFALVTELTPRMDDIERHRTLNMGIGMVVICSPDRRRHRAVGHRRGDLGDRRTRREPRATSRSSASSVPDQPAGRLASIASMTSGAWGSVIGPKRATTSPPGATRNFSKFHWMSPSRPSASAVAVSSV